MFEENDELRLSRIVFAFIFGIVGCLLLATVELGNLMAEDWFSEWVTQDSDTNGRIIRYGLAFSVAIAAVLVAVLYTSRFGRFGNAINRAFLWFGIILLLGTICAFLFDCLPEVIAGILGAGMFVGSVFILQQRYYTEERIVKLRVHRGDCPGCGCRLSPQAYFCPDCGSGVGQKCPECKGFAKLTDKHCSHCGNSLTTAS
jgi:hypothetical protein